MKPYLKYKTSGVEWIGEIPDRWNIHKLKWLIKEKLKYGANEIAESEDKGFPRYIRITDFDNDGQLKADTFKSLPFEKSKDYLLEEGDVLFARSGATVGKTFIFKHYKGQACFAGYLIKASTNKKLLEHNYLYLFTKSNAYENWKNSIFNQATIQNIGADKYQFLEIPTPPFPEQKRIAKYLDHKTAKIDSLIEKKKRLIELLKEERTAVINQAVTKGLAPNVPMKDSGIEWLGEIPGHWDVVPLTKYLSSIVDYRGRTPKKVADGIFLVTAKNIKNGLIDYSLSEEFADPQDVQSLLNRGRPEVGDVLFTTEAPLGEVANIDREDIALAQRVIKFRGKKNKLNNYFLKYWLLSVKFQQDSQSFATGSTALGIKASKLNYLRLVLPPIHEQISIVKHMEKETNRIDSIISKSEKEIVLLQEYRTALISEVVTGKIDVREEKT